MANDLQIVGNKVYYKMECVAILNDLNCLSTAQDSFKRELKSRFNNGEPAYCSYCKSEMDGEE